jgi:hypothetical protein
MSIFTKLRDSFFSAWAKLRGRHAGIMFREPADLSALVQSVQTAQNSLSFVRRFNSEMFFQRLSLNGTALNRKTAEGMYGDGRFCDIVDLRDKDRRYYFLCLYAAAHKNLTMRDIFSLDGVFSFQPNRSTDEAKRLAGAEVFALFAGNNKDEIAGVIAAMGACYAALPPPQPQYSPAYVKEYYTLADGYAGMGEMLLQLPFVPDNARKAAKKAAGVREYLRRLNQPPGFFAKRKMKRIKTKIEKP